MEALPEAISWCEIDQWDARPGAGRICMNMAMVDISHILHVERGTVATLLGRDGNEKVSAAQWGGWMGSIHCEAIARIHPG